jgi:eukaryotic translation initiation factor 2C
LKSFNVTIDPQMTVVPARILPPPGVTYRESRASIRDASWNLIKVKFHRGAPLARFAVLLIQEEGIQPRFAGTDDQNLWTFITAFGSACIDAGMQVTKDRPVPVEVGPLPRRTKEDPSRTAAINKIQEKMAMFGNSKSPPSIILVLLNKYDTHLYAGIKRLGDVDLGVHTVCMLLDKATNPKRQVHPHSFGSFTSY